MGLIHTTSLALELRLRLESGQRGGVVLGRWLRGEQVRKDGALRKV